MYVPIKGKMLHYAHVRSMMLKKSLAQLAKAQVYLFAYIGPPAIGTFGYYKMLLDSSFVRTSNFWLRLSVLKYFEDVSLK